MQESLSMVCFGFGNHLSEQYRGYLNRFAEYCTVLRPQFVIFSGGATQQRTAPGRTEAQVMHDYVVPRCPELVDTTWLLDEDAFTSLETVWNTKRILEDRTEPGRLLTYTDAGRTLKVRLCTRQHMPQWHVTQETYDMRSNPIGQLAALAIEGPMTYLPILHRPWAWYRRAVRAKRI